MKRVIALGFFDGVHLGHGALLERAVSRARQLDARACACTFDVHPASLVGGQTVELLTTAQERERLMKERYGVEEVITLPFEDLHRTSWRWFVLRHLVLKWKACHLVAGYDYRFGYRGRGDADKLRRLCRVLGVGCDIIPPVELDGQVVSSTAIRALLAQGQRERAERLLGHPICEER